jgi:DNA ligase 1
MSEFKPMLSATVAQVRDLRLPLMASPKLDGIRAIVRNGQLVSRNLKPIPNLYVQTLFGKREYEGLDGELIVGDPRDKGAFLATTSGVMSRDGTPDAVFWVFDKVPQAEDPGFVTRYNMLTYRKDELAKASIRVVPHLRITNFEAIDQYEEYMLEQGYEGIMLRSLDGRYKYGRGTLKAQDLMKLKRFEDAEATVLGVYEQQHNTNEAKKNALGHTERSSHKAGKVGKGVLGGLWVKALNGPHKGQEFGIGTGFNDEQRAALWREAGPRGELLNGRVVKFKYFPTGSKEAPRFPVWLGWRADGDM